MNRQRIQNSERVHNAGFTLLELLVSITLVSLLVVTILFGWRVASAAWQRADRRLREQRVILATHQVLEEQMASMLPYRILPPQGVPEPFFQGEPEAARFVSRYSLTDRARSGLYRIEYRVVEQKDGTKELQVNEFPLRSTGELQALLAGAENTRAGRVLRFSAFQPGPRTLTLLTGLQECRFAYYRPPDLTEPGGWSEQWRALNDELPQGMAIRAVAPADASGLQPVSIVASIQHRVLRKP
ncbi:MAG: type II secretion system protein [Acidobacteria bacterium]|nr:type II secretion system protein [Acidobacteriota bacterium]